MNKGKPQAQQSGKAEGRPQIEDKLAKLKKRDYIVGDSDDIVHMDWSSEWSELKNLEPAPSRPRLGRGRGSKELRGAKVLRKRAVAKK